MKKIKLVVSDLHLGVGKFLSQGEINSFEEFYYDERFAEFLDYYSAGDYKDAEVELILNGDILNFLQVDFRGHYLTVITENISLEKLHYIVAGHQIFFQAIKRFAQLPGRVVTYIVGNHDQCMMWPATRAYFSEVVGTQVRFKNIVYFFDGVHIEHGHMHEPANRIDPRRFFLKKDVAEPILNLPLGSHFFLDFVLKVKQENPYIDKVRPFQEFLRWGLFYDTVFTVRTLFKLAKYILNRILWFRQPARRWHLKKLLHIVAKGAIFPDLGSSARRILGDDRVHTVVFGHSHVYQYRQWGKDKEYFNTGTWTELTSLDMTSLGKITKLTYVIIEYPKEPEARPRARLKQWRGFHRIEEDVDVS